MAPQTIAADAALYESDETAWLELASELIRDRRVSEIDLDCLAEYLSDMALRERHEVEIRLIVLIFHVLKWHHQPEMRSRSWRLTVIEQRQRLGIRLGNRSLRNHAEDRLAALYPQAVERAVADTGLEANAFPAECPYTVDALLSPDIVTDAE